MTAIDQLIEGCHGLAKITHTHFGNIRKVHTLKIEAHHPFLAKTSLPCVL